MCLVRLILGQFLLVVDARVQLINFHAIGSVNTIDFATELHKAAWRGDAHAVRDLIERGVDVQATTEYVSSFLLSCLFLS
jgi:ankyrin repeat protein